MLLAIAIVCTPLTAAIVLLVPLRLLKHIEDTTTVGGTPKDIYREQAALSIEAGKLRLADRKPVPARRVMR